MEAAPNNDGDLSGSSKLGFDAMGAAEYVIKNWILGYPVLGDEANQGPKRKKKKKKKKNKKKKKKKKKKKNKTSCGIFAFFFCCLLIWFYRRLFICLKSA